ncbi:ribonuclease 1-like isoform X2 [Ananas comosus]|uniref:Ribonuclease 1-like isoform X2 n=1 Tax=Ananas comosus TaxID=4615 RepID=A0A6P5GBP9_ANACO|nr:ribonuclease 1-like isoform X2 [Ananas comosus]
MQWPGSYCDTKQSCCYPTSGKPLADFGIHGLWPNNNDGSYPLNCDSHNPFKSSEIKELIGQMQKHWPTLACPSNDGLKFWGHEWNKHGTCSESVLDQHSYFETALRLQKETNLLEILRESGIRPGGFYRLDEIKEAIKEGLGFAPGIECNRDESGTNQLYQIFLCVDNSGKQIIECPVFPRSKCRDKVEFPVFPSITEEGQSSFE